MDSKSQERLNQILAKEPNALSIEEIGFLKARRSYLKPIQLEEYDSILNPETKPAKKQPVKPNANTNIE